MSDRKARSWEVGDLVYKELPEAASIIIREYGSGYLSFRRWLPESKVLFLRRLFPASVLFIPKPRSLKLKSFKFRDGKPCEFVFLEFNEYLASDPNAEYTMYFE